MSAEFFYSMTSAKTKGSHPEMKGGERMATVVLRPNESQDQLLKRFRKKVAKSGILSTVRRKRWFVSKSELRRIQKKKAIRRFKRRVRPDNE
jgi:small subunit ribosomal protein S21